MRLPNFMCIGAAKSGTTTLYDILKHHPEIYLPSFKEPHFFDIPDVYSNGIDWYYKTYFSSVNKERCIGDFTPSYLYANEAAKRIYNTLGKNIKFIVILRHPVDRAYSHYLHSVRDEREPLDFRAAIKKEKGRLKTYEENRDFLSRLRHSYISQSKYGEMLLRYFKYYSRENFLFIHFEEDFINNRLKTIQSILSFLGIEQEIDLDIYKKSNPASKSRSRRIKKIMQKKGWWRRALKRLIPSLKFRQILKNRVQMANIISFTPKQLDISEKKEIYYNNFTSDILKTEQIIGRKMNW